MEAISTWIPVGERLPDADMVVIVCTDDPSEPIWLGYIDADDQWQFATGGRCRPSHWMELPEPPEVDHANDD